MDEMKVKTFLECTMSKAPAGTLELWESTKAMFNGRPPEQAVTALCKTSPTAGASLLAEFINQQTKADKPKFKKAIKDCTT
ncbi:uncharacterized protein LOC121048035 [Ixodes scapularis]|uniref:uncharacterized protein LOC121048035 n=1 Tax=Ixodes scapularis TaxID=6945 RepID=UPI001C380934|nr:uncharacterized protein LOC121048035 [Ixodes scapularis]